MPYRLKMGTNWLWVYPNVDDLTDSVLVPAKLTGYDDIKLDKGFIALIGLDYAVGNEYRDLDIFNKGVPIDDVQNGDENNIAFDAESFKVFVDTNLGKSSGGGNGFGVTDNRTIKTIDAQAYDVANLDNNSLLNITHQDNWTITLPDLDNVYKEFQVSILYKVNSNSTGTIVSFGDDLIDGSTLVNMYGVGLITIRKIDIDGVFHWIRTNQVSYNTIPLQGKTRVLEFNNKSTIQVQHNLGFIPVVQVWVEDGQGGYVEANVDIDHNWVTMDYFEVQLSALQNGKIIY